VRGTTGPFAGECLSKGGCSGRRLGVQEDAYVEVRQRDFLEAAAALQPSLSRQEIARYTALRDTYSRQK